jgi:hypothetical protein
VLAVVYAAAAWLFAEDRLSCLASLAMLMAAEDWNSFRFRFGVGRYFGERSDSLKRLCR